LPTFRDQLSVPSSRVKNPNRKPAEAKPYGVYIGKGAVRDTFSVAWCQSIGLMQVVEREQECGNECSSEERRSVREEIVTGAITKTQENIYMSKVRERRGKELPIYK
jgi:hypothetical protein